MLHLCSWPITSGGALKRNLVLALLTLLLLLPFCKEKESEEPTQEVFFEVKAGESTSRIALRLDSLDIISHHRLFVISAKLKGLDRSLQQGVYRLHTNMSEDSVLLMLSRGAIATVAVTIPEGLRLRDIASRLTKAGVVNQDTFLALCRDKKLLLEFNIPFGSFEGLLFPDTYSFPLGILSEDVLRVGILPEDVLRAGILPEDVLRAGILPEDVLRVMVRRFFEVAEPMLREVSLDTLLILASIVEREAYLEEERPVIASVFLNRLKEGLPLESCATIEYALPRHKERLTYADLRIPSPYNTYINTGLPPGPICSPGKASLEAVANPKKTKYLYFVSKGDGSHYFSETAAEHEQMKRKLNKERSRNGA
ncbi:Endolytic murein transglycosylase [subsurface metagenome]